MDRDEVLDICDRDAVTNVFVSSRVHAAGVDPGRLGAQHHMTLNARTRMPETRRRRATSTPISCESGNGVSAPGMR